MFYASVILNNSASRNFFKLSVPGVDLDLDLPKEKDSIDLFKKTHFVLRMNIISRFEKNCVYMTGSLEIEKPSSFWVMVLCRLLL